MASRSWHARARTASRAANRVKRQLLNCCYFAAIEAAGGDRRTRRHVRRWPTSIKAQLNRQLWSHCEEAMRAPSFLPPPIDNKTAKQVRAVFSVLDRLKPNFEGGANALANHKWRRYYAVQADVLPLIQSRPRKSGRKPNKWLDEFITIVADAYSCAGGNVSAQPRAIDGKLETPFLRVLRHVYQRLPQEHQSVTLSALEARARRQISKWKEYRAKYTNHFT